MPSTLARERIGQRSRIDHPLLDEDLTDGSAHARERYQTSSGGTRFRLCKSLKCHPQPATAMAAWKFTLEIDLGADILRAPLGNPRGESTKAVSKPIAV